MNRQFSALVAVILAIVAGGLYMTARDNWGIGHAPAAFSSIAAALITFFWFTPGARPATAGVHTEEGLQRRAIASAIVVQYLILVGSFAFWTENQPLSEMTRLLLNNFTTIVGIVIAFYFGASAYVEAKIRTDASGRSESGKEATPPPNPSSDAAPSRRS